MSSSAYKALGFVVWNGAKWYLRRRAGRALPSRRAATVGLVAAGAAVAGAAVLLAGRDKD